MKLRIDNMTCGSCARSVTASIKELDQNAVVSIDVESKLVDVQTEISEYDLIEALTEDGFPPVKA